MRIWHKKGTHYVISGIVLMALAIATGTGIGNHGKMTMGRQGVAELPKAVLSEQDRQARVVRVIDGDTIVAALDGKNRTVRLLGIDTPEVVDPRKPVQCFGREASNRAKELLNGRQVKLESDQTQGDMDKYKRLLRYVYLQDGTLINELLIKEGYAHEYTYKIPYVRQKAFKDAQRYARENKKGLWADGACDGFATSTKR